MQRVKATLRSRRFAFHAASSLRISQSGGSVRVGRAATGQTALPQTAPPTSCSSGGLMKASPPPRSCQNQVAGKLREAFEKTPKRMIGTECPVFELWGITVF